MKNVIKHWDNNIFVALSHLSTEIICILFNIKFDYMFPENDCLEKTGDKNHCLMDLTILNEITFVSNKQKILMITAYYLINVLRVAMDCCFFFYFKHQTHLQSVLFRGILRIILQYSLSWQHNKVCCEWQYLLQNG